VRLAAEREQAAAVLHQSEARFRSYVENSPVAVFVVNREGRFVDYNAAASSLLGYPAETLARMNILEVHPIEDRDAVLRGLDQLFETGRLDLETRLLREEGRPVWMSLHAARLDSGHAIAYCQDITELKAAVESMRERLALQDQLAAITAVVPGVIHSFRLRQDGSFCFPYASPALENIFGVQPGEVVEDAGAVLELIHPEDAKHLIRSVVGSARSMTPWRDEFRVRHPRRGEIWVEGHSLPNRQADGSVLWQGFLHDVTVRKRSEEMARETGRRLELATKSAGLGVWDWDIEAGTVVWDDRMCELYGIGRKDFDGRPETWTRALHPDDREPARKAGEAALRGEKECNIEYRVVHPDGKVKILRADTVVVRDRDGKPLRMIGLNRDITEQRHLEAQLLQAQKMEAVGRLAGGVAHDFNNNLTVILGYTELARMVEVNGEKFHEYLDEIIKAAEHSRDITQQLLAFSRHEIIAPRKVDLNQLLRNTDKTVSRLIGEDVRLQLATPGGIWPVLLDPAQLHQIVMNLAGNARDAMPRGGTLSIETRNVPMEEICRLGIADALPGDYVEMTVSDTGVGMDRELQRRAFEPFFTTKGVGQGTGLGLATVYGIMSQNGGFIRVVSEPGQGAAFHLYFPRMAPEEGAEVAPPRPVASVKGCVLLVEDEDSVRLMARLMLEKVGFSVLAAPSPREALEICRRTQGRIDCLLTDVIMPEMTGVELSVAVRAIRPGIGIVYMSGYTADMIAHHGVLEPGVVFVQKPFNVTNLIENIHQAMRLSRTP
jgi:PAS domain S-box-containing protein